MRGVRAEGDVPLAERHDPQHPRRRDLPRADRDRQHPPARAGLDEADRDRPPRLRRPVPRHRPRRARARASSRSRTPRSDGSEPIELEVYDFPGGGIAMAMYNLDASIRDFARASLRYGLDRGYPVYLSTKNTILKRYDGRFKDIFAEVYEAEFKADFEAAGHHLRTPPDRRHGRRRAEVGGRLRVGLQELRRRRAVRHRRAGLRLARADDQRADERRRQDRGGGGRARHGHPPLPPAPAGQAHLHQPDRLDLRLDARPVGARAHGRHARGRATSPRRSSAYASRPSKAGR